jgi:hypothetical protein
MKKLALLIFSLILFSQIKAQVAIGYYPFQSILSVSTSTEKAVWADFRIETNTFFSNMNMELAPMWNLKRTDWVNYYVGFGTSFNPANTFQALPFVNGYAVYFGSRIKPMQKYKNVQLLFEISPYINQEFSSGNLRTLFGLAYNW